MPLPARREPTRVLPSAPLLVFHSHAAPDLTQSFFLSGRRPKPRPTQQDPACPRDHPLQKRPKPPHRDPRTAATLRGSSQVRVTEGAVCTPVSVGWSPGSEGRLGSRCLGVRGEGCPGEWSGGEAFEGATEFEFAVPGCILGAILRGVLADFPEDKPVD